MDTAQVTSVLAWLATNGWWVAMLVLLLSAFGCFGLALSEALALRRERLRRSPDANTAATRVRERLDALARTPRAKTRRHVSHRALRGVDRAHSGTGTVVVSLDAPLVAPHPHYDDAA